MSSRIELRGVAQTFLVRGDDDKKLREFVALDDLNLDISAGEFLTIVGPSGCGKTTFINLCDGLLKPTAGHITIDGKTVTGPGIDRGMVVAV